MIAFLEFVYNILNKINWNCNILECVFWIVVWASKWGIDLVCFEVLEN